jgi:hypothetical protein
MDTISIAEIERFLERKIVLKNGEVTQSDRAEYRKTRDELDAILWYKIKSRKDDQDYYPNLKDDQDYYLDLRDLGLTGNEKELADLQHFDWLDYLKLGGNCFGFSNGEYLAPLTHLPVLPDSLVALDIDDACLSSIQNLATLKNLQVLKLYRCQVKDISPLAGLTSLVNLDLSYNREHIQDFSPLANLKNLLQLDLNFSEIGDVSVLANLTKLQVLKANKCNITDISFLENLTQLTDLQLSGNNITDISPLKKLKSLKNLEIKDNPVDALINQALGKETKRFPNKKDLKMYLNSL